MDRVGKDVHHSDPIKETYDNLEASWMERNTHGIILELLVDLQLEAKLGAPTPDLDCLVGGASGDQVFLDAHVHTTDRSGVERVDKVLVDRFDVFIVEQADRHFEYLIILSCEDKSVLSR